MSGRGGGGGGRGGGGGGRFKKVMVQPINLIFRFLQSVRVPPPPSPGPARAFAELGVAGGLAGMGGAWGRRLERGVVRWL